ncbi:MAG: hypothetical protein FJ038_03920 [Chloroflexi bacterium]|nr:hypothetical protein [Chloroflexota bacterium]
MTITQQQLDARALIEDVLARYDLGSEAQWAWDLIIQGVGQVQLLQELREREAYQTRFAGMALRREQGRAAISEGEYIAWERQAEQLGRAAGLPEEFFTREFFAQQIGYDRSINELSAIYTNAYKAVVEAPPEVRAAFNEFTGVMGDAAFAAYLLDPERSVAGIERMAQKAIVSGNAATFGFEVGEGLADQIVSRGIQGGQALQAFQQINDRRDYFRETVSDTQDVTATEAIEAQFGTDPDANRVVNRRLEERQAAFGGGASSVATDQGARGLGAAGR